MLRDFKKRKRERLRRLEAMKQAATVEKEEERNNEVEVKEEESGIISHVVPVEERGRLPKKLTFGLSESAALFVDEAEEDQTEEDGVAVSAVEEEEEEADDDVSTQLGSRPYSPSAPAILSHTVSAAAIENHDNLLHLDLSKTTLDVLQQQQQQPKSAPIHSSSQAPFQQGPSSVASSSSKSNINSEKCVSARYSTLKLLALFILKRPLFRPIPGSTEGITSDLRTTYVGKRKHGASSCAASAAGSNRGEDGGGAGRLLHQGNSNESLAILGARLRKISGNASDGGTSSTGGSEVRFLRMRGGGTVGPEEDKTSSTGGGGGGPAEDRVVFVSAERKVPFAVGSVLAFAKAGGKNVHRSVGRRCSPTTRCRRY